MKKYLFILSVLALGFASCSKDKQDTVKFDPVAQAKIDEKAIQAYLTAHPSISASQDPSGLYYQVIDEGTGAQITSTSKVTVSYVGTNINDVQFDSNANFTTAISDNTNIITGWKIGLPKLKNGGKILLIIPSELAYGPYANGPVPANAVLVFTITVKAVDGAII